MNDWRIGRLIRHQNYFGNIGSGITLPPNRQRIGLLVSILFNVNPLVDSDALSVIFDSTPTINIAEVNCPFTFSIVKHGDLVMGGVTVQTINGDQPVMAVEFIMPETYLAAGLEQFESEYARGHS